MTRTSRIAAAAAAVSFLLAGCTVGGDTPDDPATTGAEAAPVASATEEQPEGLSSEEISAELLDRGEALAEREPLASVEAEVPLTPAAAVLTLDVVEVVATPSGTVVDMRVTAPGPVTPQSGTFSAEEFVNPEYIADIDLVDPTTEETLRPVLAAEGGRWCQCSTIPGGLGTEPTPLTATFPVLDEATTTVDIRFGNFPVVEDVPVSRG